MKKSKSNVNSEFVVLPRLTKFFKVIAAVIAVVAVVGILWSATHKEDMQLADVRHTIGKVTALQKIGKSDSNHTVYLGAKNKTVYAFKVNDKTNSVSKEALPDLSVNKISYLTQVQLYKNLHSYKLKENQIIYKGKTYLPVYQTSANDNINYLTLAKRQDKTSTKSDSKADSKNNNSKSKSVKKADSNIKLEPISLYVSDKKALTTISDKYKVDMKHITVTDIKTDRNKGIVIYFITNRGFKPYKLTISANNTVYIAVGHYNSDKKSDK